MNQSKPSSSPLLALPLLLPALGIAACLGVTLGPRDLSRATGLYTLCFMGAVACWALASLWAWRYREACSGKGGLALIAGVALALRLWLMPETPTLSTDYTRYLWDGRVVASGQNPYTYPPDAPQLQHLRTRTWDDIPFPDSRTVYPPVTEAFFALIAVIRPDNILAMKIAVGLAELACLALVWLLLRRLRRPPSELILYAWQPLVIAEVWFHGHQDALGLAVVLTALLAMTAASGSPTALRVKGGVWYGLAAATKIQAAFVWPVMARRGRGDAGPGLGIVGLAVAAVVVALVFLPFWGPLHHLLEGIRNMAQRWDGNGSFYAVSVMALQPLLGSRQAARTAARLVCGVILLAGSVALALRSPASQEERFRIVGYALMLGFFTSPLVQPWYLVWLAPFAAVTRTPSMLAFVSLATLGYLRMFEPPLGRGGPWFEYWPIYLCLAWEIWRMTRGRTAATTESAGPAAAPAPT